MKRLKKKNELKIGIESMLKCGGSCDGCVLTYDERKSSDNFFFSDDDLVVLKSKLSCYVKDIEKNFGSIDELALNFGQGDHFLLDDDSIVKFVKWMSETFEGQGSSFITASAISGHNHLKRKVDLFYNESLKLNQPLLVDVVYAPDKTKIDKFSDTYSKNITYINNSFGGMDFVINLGKDIISSTSPKDLSDFVIKNKISISTIVLTPTVYQGKDRRSYMDWLDEYYRLWVDNLQSSNPHTYEINYGPVLGKFFETDFYIPSDNEELYKDIYVDSDLNVSFAQTGLGDFGLSHRFGFAPLFNLKDEGSLFDNLTKAMVNHNLYMKRKFLNNTCLNCQFISLCQEKMLGYKLDKESKGCPLGVYDLFYNIKTYCDKGLDLNSTCYDVLKPMLQYGVTSNPTNKGESIETIINVNKENIIF